MRNPKSPSARLLLYIKNIGYEASLEKRKIYVSLPDLLATKHGQVRVIDESGEDYLFPKTFFLPIRLPEPLRKAVLSAA